MSVFVGKKAPDFEADALLPDGSFGKVKLSDYAGQYMVLFMYPLDQTYVCPTELIQFSDSVEQFEEIKCSVVACSTDSEYSHLAWTEKPRQKGGLGKMTIPILADKTHAISKAYNVHMEEAGISLRGLFIISDKGIVRHITVNDLPVGRNVEEVLRLVKAFQFTDVHGEVCPAGWKPGSKSMKADPKGSQEYFATQDAEGPASSKVTGKRAAPEAETEKPAAAKA